MRWILSFLDIEEEDASLLQGREVIVNVDAFDGDLHWYPFLSPLDAGWRAMLGAWSDVAVKGGKPLWALISTRIPLEYSDKVYKAFLHGANEFCRNVGCRIVGGDTDVTGRGSFRASIFVAGPAVRYVRRSGASPGDVIISTGAFGLSSVLYRYKNGRCFVEAVDAFRRPQPLGFASWEKVLPHITSSIDNSDGLAVSLHLLAESSSVGIILDDVPLHPLLVRCGGDIYDALYLSGEEYQFIYTVPRGIADYAVSTTGGFVIGRVVEGKGVRMYDGRVIERRGWVGGAGYT